MDRLYFQQRQKKKTILHVPLLVGDIFFCIIVQKYMQTWHVAY